MYVGNFVKRQQRLKMAQWINLYCKNLPKAWDEAKLKELCAEFGEISSVLVVMDPDSGKSKGFGYIDFKEHEAAKACVAAMHDKEVECMEEVEASEESKKADQAEAKSADKADAEGAAGAA